MAFFWGTAVLAVLPMLAQAAPASRGGWADVIKIEYESRIAAQAAATAARPRFPLAVDTFGTDELLAAFDSMLTGKLTMGPKVEQFEKELAEYLGVECAVMVNSGSSANLVAVAAALEMPIPAPDGRLDGQRRLRKGDEVLVSSVAWSTSVAPLYQLGLVPVFVDVDPRTLNMDVEQMANKIGPKTKGILLVQAMGNSPDMDGFMMLADQHNLVVIEDTCEGLGSFYDGKPLGTIGDFGTYSFYFSHHMTSGEGGAVVSSHKDGGMTCDLLKSLRAHGWTRHLSPERAKAIEARYPGVDTRYMFTRHGFNVRPVEAEGAIAIVQLGRLAGFNSNRRKNYDLMREALAPHRHIIAPAAATAKADPAWFGLPLLLSAPYAYQRDALFAHLEARGVETRPIISGNFLRQPVCQESREPGSKHYGACGVDVDPDDYPAADYIHLHGMYIGLHPGTVMSADDVSVLTDAIVSFAFAPKYVTMVTGSNGLVGTAVQHYVRRLRPGGLHRFVFVNRTHADLMDPKAARKLLFVTRPTRIIHLAAKIAAMETMSHNHAEYNMANQAINANLLQASAALAKSGLLGATDGNTTLLRVTGCLSSAMLPSGAGIDSEVTEADISMFFEGPRAPIHPIAAGYGSAKRQQLQMSSWLTKETPGLNVVNLMPSNIFGPATTCDAKGPLVNALIAKAFAAKNAGTAMVVFGSGKPKRQMLFSLDLAKVLVWSLEHYSDADVPLIVTGEEHAVQELAQLAAETVGFTGEISNDETKADGPMRRAASSDKLKTIMPRMKWTPLASAMTATSKACYPEQDGGR